MLVVRTAIELVGSLRQRHCATARNPPEITGPVTKFSLVWLTHLLLSIVYCARLLSFKTVPDFLQQLHNLLLFYPIFYSV